MSEAEHATALENARRTWLMRGGKNKKTRRKRKRRKTNKHKIKK